MPNPFPFLELPPEIREKIYRQIVSSPSPIHLGFSHHSDPFSSPSYPTFPGTLLLTSVQIYHEIRPLFFSTNTFALTIRRSNLALTHEILCPSFRDNLRQIRTLRLTILRWGKKSFFLNTLVPVVEDCILNGRLRVLEVVVKGQFLEGLRGGMGLREGVGDEFENWRGVRRVLGDAYLEVGKLLTAKVEEEEVSKGGFIEDLDGEELDDVTALLLGWENGK